MTHNRAQQLNAAALQSSLEYFNKELIGVKQSIATIQKMAAIQQQQIDELRKKEQARQIKEMGTGSTEKWR